MLFLFAFQSKPHWKASPIFVSARRANLTIAIGYILYMTFVFVYSDLLCVLNMLYMIYYINAPVVFSQLSILSLRARFANCTKRIHKWCRDLLLYRGIKTVHIEIILIYVYIIYIASQSILRSCILYILLKINWFLHEIIILYSLIKDFSFLIAIIIGWPSLTHSYHQMWKF